MLYFTSSHRKSERGGREEEWERWGKREKCMGNKIKLGAGRQSWHKRCQQIKSKAKANECGRWGNSKSRKGKRKESHKWKWRQNNKLAWSVDNGTSLARDVPSWNRNRNRNGYKEIFSLNFCYIFLFWLKCVCILILIWCFTTCSGSFITINMKNIKCDIKIKINWD